MAFWGDYHTHTTYSHGKGSVLDNAEAAARKGLREIAITDHGLRHIVFGIRRRQLPAMVSDCEQATQKTGVLVIPGVENNIHSFDGTFDLKPPDLEKLGIVQGGYHKAVFMRSFAQQWSFHFRNFFFWYYGKTPAKLMARNTDTYLKLIDNYEVDFIGHLNRDIRTDAVEIARFAKQKGTFIEINSKRNCITDAELEKMTEEGVTFICNSDAHSPDRVGNMDNAVAIIERLHIPYGQIANWEKLPDFRSSNYKKATGRSGGADAGE